MGLYEKIKLLAKERKISIRKLEEDLDYGNGTIRRWETNSPGIDKVEKVADYFDVSTDYLLGRANDPIIKNENATPEFSSIQRKARSLSQIEQQKLLKIMQATFDDLDEGNFEEDDDDDL